MAKSGLPGGSDYPRSTSGFDTASYDESCSEDITSLIYREIQSGPEKTIVGIVDAKGVCQLYDYLASLSQSDQTQFKARFERYTQLGYLKSPDEMRMIKEADEAIRVHEMKTRNGHRIFGIQESTRFVASHGVKKPKPNQVTKHASQARDAYIDAKSREEAEKGK